MNMYLNSHNSMLSLPVFMSLLSIYKTNQYPYYVKIIISHTFLTSLIPTLILINSGYEAIISNWYWMTIQNN